MRGAKGKGVLFIGASGSGKSTCTLACAMDGFDYLGDDHNGMQLTPDGRCLGHSFYNAARIGPTHLQAFPELRPFEVAPHSEHDHKSLVWMTEVCPGRVATTCDIKAVIMPRIVLRGPTRFRPASKVQTLVALAPSTLKRRWPRDSAGLSSWSTSFPKCRVSFWSAARMCDRSPNASTEFWTRWALSDAAAVLDRIVLAEDRRQRAGCHGVARAIAAPGS